MTFTRWRWLGILALLAFDLFLFFGIESPPPAGRFPVQQRLFAEREQADKTACYYELVPSPNQHVQNQIRILIVDGVCPIVRYGYVA